MCKNIRHTRIPFKTLISLLCILCLLYSCTMSSSYGAARGSMYGGMIGGAVGGLVRGHRGHHLGTVVGMITGAAVGAAAASAEEHRYREYVDNYERSSRRSQSTSRSTERGHSDSNNRSYSATGRERGYNDGMVVSNVTQQTSQCPLTLRNLRFIDDGGNQVLNREEGAKIIFELANTTSEAIYDVVPYVYESNGNTHVMLSPSTRIEVVKPGDVVRYTCSMRSDKKISDGVLNFCISVACAESDFVTLSQFTLPTAKK